MNNNEPQQGARNALVWLLIFVVTVLVLVGLVTS